MAYVQTYESKLYGQSISGLPILGKYEGEAHATEDGVRFTPAKFYDVAGNNIGILVEYAGKQAAMANKLFSSAHFAGAYILKLMDTYDAWGNEQRERFKATITKL